MKLLKVLTYIIIDYHLSPILFFFQIKIVVYCNDAPRTCRTLRLRKQYSYAYLYIIVCIQQVCERKLILNNGPNALQ